MAKSKSGRKKARQLAKYKPKSTQPARVEPQEANNQPEIEPESGSKNKPKDDPEDETETKLLSTPETKPSTTPKAKETVQSGHEAVVNKLYENKSWSQVVAQSLTRSYSYEIERFLEESRKKVPIFLFRASRPGSGSGVEIGTEDGNVKMVPRAFLDKGSAGIHASIYQIPKLPEMIDIHCQGVEHTSSQFSSWTGTLLVAIGFLFRDERDARISVIDTRKFPKTGIYFVPNLCTAGLSSLSLDDEYLVHGVVQGGPDSGYRSVLWADLLAKGIDTLLPEFELQEPLRPLTTARVRLAKHVASLFGKDLMFPVTAALLTCHNHVYEEMGWVHIYTKKDEVAIIRTILFDGTQTEIENFLEVKPIMEDIVYLTGHHSIIQFILLLRRLTEQTHGNDATELDRSILSKFVQKEAREFWANRKFLAGRREVESADLDFELQGDDGTW